MALTNAEKQKRWRDKRNALAKEALALRQQVQPVTSPVPPATDNAEIEQLRNENARLERDLETALRHDVMHLSLAALAKRKALFEQAKQNKEARLKVEAVPDDKTKEAFEREIKSLRTQLRNANGKVRAFMSNGKTILSNADRKNILVCLHPDGVLDPKEKSRRERAFKLFSNAVPECDF